MSSGGTSKPDWVSSRLEETRGASFRVIQLERAAEEPRRKASFSLLDSKEKTAMKKQLYKHIDATFDTMWIRLVYLSQSRFKAEELIAHGDLVRVTAIALEVRQALFDLLELQEKVKLLLGAPMHVAYSVEFTSKSLSRLYGVTQLLEKLLELASEIKIRIAQLNEQQLQSSGAIKSSASGLRSLPQTDSNEKKVTANMPPLVDAPIVLLEDRLQHHSSLDREALFTLVPQLRDLRGSLGILYQLRCDDAAVSLALADSLGESYFRVIQHATLKDEFAPAILAAWNSARANSWIILRELHEVNLSATAQAAPTRQHTRRDLNVSTSSTSANRALSPTPASPTNAGGAQQQTVPPVFAPIQKPAGPPPSASSAAASPQRSVSPPPTLLASSLSPSHSDGNDASSSPRLSPSPEPSPSSTSSSLPPLQRRESEDDEVLVMQPIVSPVSPLATARAASPPPPAQNEEWVEARNGDSKFFYNTKTGQSAWTKPPPSAASSTTSATSSAAPPLLSTSKTTSAASAVPYSSTAPSTSSFLSSLTNDDSEEEQLLSSPVANPVTLTPKVGMVTAKGCAVDGCTRQRFSGRPYCVAHLN